MDHTLGFFCTRCSFGELIMSNEQNTSLIGYTIPECIPLIARKHFCELFFQMGQTIGDYIVNPPWF